jgi:hypothetical protein
MKTYDQFLKGIGDSKYIQNAFDDLINVDVHTEPGSIRPQLALAKESSTTVADGLYMATDKTTGDTYGFSKTDGSIYKRTKSTGVWSAVRTNSNGAHKGARYYRGYIYYATDTKLGRFDLASTWNDNFQNLTSGQHAMVAFDLILYIANDNDVAQFDDADVFSASGLDLPTDQDIQALKSIGDDLLSLGRPGDYLNDAKIFRWDTYSSSWSVSDAIKGKKPYAFLDADNYTFVVCQSGEIFIYSSSVNEIFSQIRNAETTTGHQLTANFLGKPLIANGGKIYSLHRKNRNYPFSLTCEYTCSAGEDATIHSLEVTGDELLVSWEYDGTFGVDSISTNYANAEIITPTFEETNAISVQYDELPSGTSIGISLKKDGESSFTALTTEIDSTDKREVRTAEFLDLIGKAQAKITLNSNGSDCPIIDSIKVK